MITEVADTISTFFCSREVLRKEDLPICRYGAEIIISTLLGFGAILGVGGIFNKFDIAVVYLIGIVPLRMYTGGYHAKTYLTCNMIFAFLFAVNLFLLQMVEKFEWDIILLIISFWVLIPIIKYAPIENKNKRLTYIQRKKYKNISLILCSVYYMVSSLLLAGNSQYGVVLLLVLNTVAILMMEVKVSERNGK